MKSADGSQLSLYRPTCLANFFSALRLRRANHKNLQLKGGSTGVHRGPRPLALLVDPLGALTSGTPGARRGAGATPGLPTASAASARTVG